MWMYEIYFTAHFLCFYNQWLLLFVNVMTSIVVQIYFVTFIVFSTYLLFIAFLENVPFTFTQFM
jgi:hypothetical protein